MDVMAYHAAPARLAGTFTTESQKDLFCHNTGKKCFESKTQFQSWGKAFTAGQNFVFAIDL